MIEKHTIEIFNYGLVRQPPVPRMPPCTGTANVTTLVAGLAGPIYGLCFFLRLRSSLFSPRWKRRASAGASVKHISKLRCRPRCGCASCARITLWTDLVRLSLEVRSLPSIPISRTVPFYLLENYLLFGILQCQASAARHGALCTVRPLSNGDFVTGNVRRWRIVAARLYHASGASFFKRATRMIFVPQAQQPMHIRSGETWRVHREIMRQGKKDLSNCFASDAALWPADRIPPHICDASYKDAIFRQRWQRRPTRTVAKRMIRTAKLKPRSVCPPRPRAISQQSRSLVRIHHSADLKTKSVYPSVGPDEVSRSCSATAT